MNYLQAMADLSNKNKAYRFIFLKVNQIKLIDEIAYAFGTDIINSNYVAVRLNSIDESAQDYVRDGKSKNIQDAKVQITRLFSGSNARESLIEKRNSRHAAYLAFERCIELPNQQDGIKYFRSHWSKTISAHNDIEFVVGLANISYIDERGINTKYSSGKIRASANLIEYVRYLQLNNIEESKQIVSFALRNRGKNLLREGSVSFVIHQEDNPITSFTVKQSYTMHQGQNNYGDNIEFSMPANEADSIKEFLSITDKQNEYSVKKDIFRIIMHVFCGEPINADSFSINTPEYLQEMRTMLLNLKKGNYQVKVIGERILRFGPRSITKLIPNDRFDPLFIYKRKLVDSNGTQIGIEPTYLPTVFGLQFSLHDRRIIVFHERMFFDASSGGKSLSMNELTVENSKNQPLRVINPNTL